ncbi:Hypothetical predicted protein [Pelobates cultripes]|uniref:Uncharacterized protein n=1 Tax=Pelobates cultripes TaxID=61616 RepID=A0AAD1T797_PELCU|nr:Hypothetical predicted protein [Pelobates cultripes]
MLLLAQCAAVTLMVCVIVTNWVVVKITEVVTGAIQKLCRDLNLQNTRPSSSRFCNQPLLGNLACNIGLMLITIGGYEKLPRLGKSPAGRPKDCGRHVGIEDAMPELTLVDPESQLHFRNHGATSNLFKA